MSAAAYRVRSPVAEWEVRQLGSKTGIELAGYPAFEKLATKWREQNPVENALLSRSPMKDVDAHIRRGRAALAKAIEEKTTVHRAMFRNGLGWVDFVWGSEGKIKPSGRSVGAMGIAHVYEARARKDGMTESETTALLDSIVEAIAKGTEIHRIEHADTMNVTVDFNGVEAVLVKSPGSNAWVLNGWKVKPVVAGAGYVAPGATQSNTTTARDGVGAGFNSNVPKLSRAGNTPTAAERADAIIARPAVNVRPVDAVMRQLSHVTRFDKLTSGLYNKVGYLLDRFTPEQIKTGIISDYGIPKAATDRRVLMQGAMKQQLRGAGELIDRLSMPARAESQVATLSINMETKRLKRGSDRSPWQIAILQRFHQRSMLQMP